MKESEIFCNLVQGLVDRYRSWHHFSSGKPLDNIRGQKTPIYKLYLDTVKLNMTYPWEMDKINLKFVPPLLVTSRVS